MVECSGPGAFEHAESLFIYLFIYSELYSLEKHFQKIFPLSSQVTSMLPWDWITIISSSSYELVVYLASLIFIFLHSLTSGLSVIYLNVIDIFKITSYIELIYPLGYFFLFA